MITFTTALVLLVLGYAVYGAFVERVFGADASRKTPCYTMADGVDYTPMPTWKVYLIQFLNIAGTGPIFGAILGILYGPAAYLWIVFGCIFGGAVHDYLSGMISLRKNGASLPEVVGDELGAGIRLVMRVFSLILMVLVGTVFVTTPAGLLASMTGDWGVWGSALFWSVVIFVYYVLATLLPIDTLIGRIYPLFGVALLFMAVGVLVGIFTHDGWMPEITSAFESHHPDRNLSIFPMLFITIACGAISGFHATQSPMMARCMKNEKLGRRVFYGAMITEGVVALIWAAAAIAFGQFLGIGHNAAAYALAAGFFQKEQAGQAHGPRGGKIQRKIADWIAAQIDHEIIHSSAVDLVIRQDITLVLFRQGAGYFWGQLGVMLNKNFFRQLADLLNIAGFGHLLVGGFHGEPP